MHQRKSPTILLLQLGQKVRILDVVLDGVCDRVMELVDPFRRHVLWRLQTVFLQKGVFLFGLKTVTIKMRAILQGFAKVLFLAFLGIYVILVNLIAVLIPISCQRLP